MTTPDFPKPRPVALQSLALRASGLTAEQVAEQLGTTRRMVLIRVQEAVKHYDAHDTLHAYAIAVGCGHIAPTTVIWKEQWEKHYQQSRSSQEHSD